MDGIKEPETISSVNNDIKDEQRTKEKLKDMSGFQQRGCELLRVNLLALVDNEDDVTVTVNQGTHITVFEVKVNKADIGLVIGKQGQTARALRRILWGFAIKHKVKAVMEIVE